MDDKNTSIPVTDGDAEAPVEDSLPESSNSQAAAPQSVMDVTPPPHDEIVTTDSEPVGPPAVDSAAEEEPMPDLATEPSEVATEPETPEVVDTPPADEPLPASAEPVVTPTGPMGQSVVNPAGSEPMPANDAPAKKSGKTMVMVVAILLALVLAAIAVLVYMKSKDSTKKSASTKTTTQKTATVSTDKTPITGADVDAASKNVDSNLSGLDETKDYNSDSLSDKSLGLQ